MLKIYSFIFVVCNLASAVFFDTFLINYLTKNVFSAFFFLKICVSQKKAVTLHAFFARTI